MADPRAASLLEIRAVTGSEALAYLNRKLGQRGAPAAEETAARTGERPTSNVSVADADWRLLLRFTAALYDSFKTVRARVRAGECLASPPAYPSEDDRQKVVELLERLGIRKAG